MKEILEKLRNEESCSIELLKSFVEIESFSHEKEGIDQLSKKLELVFSKYPLQMKRMKEEDYGDHISFELGNGSKQILFISHLDTVYPKGTLAKMPFQLDGERIKGPGVIDIKSSYVMMYHIFGLFLGEDLGDYKLVWLLTSDEEIGSPSGKYYVEREAKKSDVVLVLEPAANGGALKTSRKGGGKYTVEVFGKSAHAGLNPEEGANAIEELAQQILTISSFANKEIGTTINAGEIKGGSLFNVVPDYASAEFDVRVLEMNEVERIERAFQQLTVNNPKTKLKVTGSVYRPPMLKNERADGLFRITKNTAQKIGIELSEVMVGGGSDGNYAAAVGATVLDGLGVVGGNAHSPDEYVVTASIAERTSILYELVKQILNNES